MGPTIVGSVGAMLTAKSYSVPATRALQALDARRIVLLLDDGLAIFDASSGAISARRAILGIRSFRVIPGVDAWIALERDAGPALIAADLSGDLVTWPDADRLACVGVVGEVAILSDRRELVCFDLQARAVIARQRSDVEWDGVHAEARVVFGRRARTREARRARASRWIHPLARRAVHAEARRPRDPAPLPRRDPRPSDGSNGRPRRPPRRA